MVKKRIALILLIVALGIGLLRVPILRAVNASFDMTVRIVDSTGTVINGVASAVSASPDRTVRVVDSTGKVVDSFGGGAPSGAAGGALNGTYPNPGLNPLPGITSQGTHTSTASVLLNGYALNEQFLGVLQGGTIMWGEPYFATVASLPGAGSTPDPIVLDAADGACTASAPAVGGGTAECIVHWTGAAWQYVKIPDGPFVCFMASSAGGEVYQCGGYWNDGGNYQYLTTSAGGGVYNAGNSLLRLNHADLKVSAGSTLGSDTIVDSTGTGASNFPNGIKIAGSQKGTLFATTTISASAPAVVGCTDTTVAVTNATSAMTVAVSPQANPNGGGVVTWSGYISAGGTADVRVCALTVDAAPPAITYNVTVLN